MFGETQVAIGNCHDAQPAYLLLGSFNAGNGGSKLGHSRNNVLTSDHFNINIFKPIRRVTASCDSIADNI